MPGGTRMTWFVFTLAASVLVTGCYYPYPYGYPSPYNRPYYQPQPPRPAPQPKPEPEPPQLAPGEMALVVRAPDIAENGAVVPVTVQAYGLEAAGRKARSLHVFSCRQRKQLAGYVLSPRSVPFAASRIKLWGTDTVVATAALDDGQVLQGSAYVRVTMGGMGDGGGIHHTAKVQGGPQPDATGTTWLPSSLAPGTARLVTAGRDMPLHSYRADVTVEGFKARVLLDLIFRNDQAGTREGRFQLRLPDGSSPYYLAFGDAEVSRNDGAPLSRQLSAAVAMEPQILDFKRTRPRGDLKEAVMAAAGKAATAYHETVAAQIDPALVEWEGAGVFSVRVFPLRPGATHRILIGYDMDLPTAETGGYRYRFEAPPGLQAAQLNLYLPAGTMQRLSAARQPDGRAQVDGKQVLEYRVPPGSTAEFQLTDDHPVMIGSDGEGSYFATRFVPRLPDSLAIPVSDKAVFALDTSLSSKEHFADYTAFAQRLLRDNADVVKQFAVLLFDVGTYWWRPAFVENNAANRQALMRDLAKIELTGATDLTRMLEQLAAPAGLTHPTAASWDAFLFTDGHSSWGPEPLRVARVAANGSRVQRLTVYAPSPSEADVGVLSEIATPAQGRVFYLADLAHMPQPSRSHRYQGWVIEHLQVPGATDLVISGGSRQLVQSQPLTIAGRGRPSGANLVATVRRGDRLETISQPLGPFVPSALAPRIFGQAAVALAEDQDLLREKDRLILARHFRIPRRTASLLMLESDADYDEYGIYGRGLFDRRPRDISLSGWDLAPEPRVVGPRTRPQPPLWDDMRGPAEFGEYLRGRDCEEWAVALTQTRLGLGAKGPDTHPPLHIPAAAFGLDAGPAARRVPAGIDGLRELTAALEGETGDRDALEHVAKGLEARELYAEAYAVWRRYQRAGGDALAAELRMAVLSARLGRTREALRRLEYLRRLDARIAYSHEANEAYRDVIDEIIRTGQPSDLVEYAKARRQGAGDPRP